MYKNSICFFYMIFCCSIIFSFEIALPYKCEDLYGFWNSALESNVVISEARKLKETANINKKYLQGLYSPTLSIGSQSITEDNIIDLSSFIADATVNFLQPLPGGIEIGFNWDYGFSVIDFDNTKEIVQLPMLNMYLSQSMLPFWIQGKKKDPQKIFYDNQLKYYENNLNFCILQTIQNVAQYYIYMKIYEYQIMQCDEFIRFKEKLLTVVEDNVLNGLEKKAKITELRGEIWKEVNNRNELALYFEQYKEDLKNECGISSLMEKKENIFNFNLNIEDPYLKMINLQLESKDNEEIIRKQETAPSIKIAIQPEWNLEQVKLNNWTDAWNKINSLNWTTAVSIDFSNLLYGNFSKQEKIIENERSILEKKHENYVKNKKNLLSRYASLRKMFNVQVEKSKELYKNSELELTHKKTIYEKGEISLLDYESYFVENENKRYMFYINELYHWLFNFLFEINSL